MRTFYHGTSYENALNIIKNGFGGKTAPEKTIWNCSNNSRTYLAESDEFEEGFELAISAAKTAAAYYDSKSTKIAVFEFQIPEEVVEEYLLPDRSCPNMDDCYTIENEDLNELINLHRIGMKVRWYEDSYQPFLRAFYLSGLCKDYFNLEMLEPALIDCIDVIENSDVMDKLGDYLFERGEEADLSRI